MIGIKTNIITTLWKNYVIKADAEKARYHKVEYRTDNLQAVISATGLVPGKKYTFSARIRLNIQETDATKVFEFEADAKNFEKWYNAPEQPISGKGDIDEFLSVTIATPRRCGREHDMAYWRHLHAPGMELRPPRWGLLYLRESDGERGRQATAVHRPGVSYLPSGERRAA